MKKIAACYIRVSTDDQTELSPDSQLEALKEYAETHDYIIPEEYIYKDEGISGRSAKKRPAFNTMIGTAKIKPKPFDAVLLWKFSRFARNRTDAIVYKNLLRNELGIDVISISESLGEDRGTAIILESMFEAMDEYYSINLSTEVKRSMKLKAEKGQPLSVAPFGYKMENRKFVIDPEKAEIVRYIFNSYENGVGVRKIATDLASSGVLTNRGCVPDNRFVGYVLQNPVYIGYTRWCADGHANYSRQADIDIKNVILAKGSHEPIIIEEQFERVQARMKEIKQKFAKYQRPEQPATWLFKGLIKCGTCGATLVRSSAKEPSIQCHNYGRGQCRVSHHISVSKATDCLLRALEQAIADLNFNVISTAETKNEEKKLAMLRRALGLERDKLQKIRAAYEAGVDTIDEYAAGKKRVTANIQELERELKRKSKEQKTSFDKADFGRKVANVLKVVTDDSVEIDTKNSALRTIIDHIDFCKPENKFSIFFYL